MSSVSCKVVSRQVLRDKVELNKIFTKTDEDSGFWLRDHKNFGKNNTWDNWGVYTKDSILIEKNL